MSAREYGQTPGCSRRAFLGGCGAYVAALMAAGANRGVLAAAPDARVTLTEPFARVEQLGEGIWAVVSTPGEGAMTTLSNGGIIAGKDAVLAIEGFNSQEGGMWLSRVARKLTGRPPDYVALTHFHPDHSNGLSGYLVDNPDVAIIGTIETRELLLTRRMKPAATPETGATMVTDEHRLLAPNRVIVDSSRPTEIDLGGRVVRLTPRQGHTPSDLVAEVSEPRAVWCGDLVFNGMFPYYGDALPSALTRHCQELLHGEAVYVPGHGPVSDREGLKPYLALLEDVEQTARKAYAAGIPAAEAWKSYRVPEALGEWRFFWPDIHRHAFEAWEKELKKGG